MFLAAFKEILKSVEATPLKHVLDQILLALLHFREINLQVASNSLFVHDDISC